MTEQDSTDPHLPNSPRESSDVDKTGPAAPAPQEEIGGRKGPDPVRYGDWEKNGRCVDF